MQRDNRAASQSVVTQLHVQHMHTSYCIRRDRHYLIVSGAIGLIFADSTGDNDSGKRDHGLMIGCTWALRSSDCGR
jgi:hypothetical protein